MYTCIVIYIYMHAGMYIHIHINIRHIHRYKHVYISTRFADSLPTRAAVKDPRKGNEFHEECVARNVHILRICICVYIYIYMCVCVCKHTLIAHLKCVY